MLGSIGWQGRAKIALRVLLFLVPAIGGFITYRICRELQARDGEFEDPEMLKEMERLRLEHVKKRRNRQRE